MAENFTFELVSPENLLLSGEAEMVTIPGTEGDMGILAKHTAVMTSLRPGLIGVKMADGTENDYFVRGGFADVTPTSVKWNQAGQQPDRCLFQQWHGLERLSHQDAQTTWPEPGRSSHPQERKSPAPR